MKRPSSWRIPLTRRDVLPVTGTCVVVTASTVTRATPWRASGESTVKGCARKRLARWFAVNAVAGSCACAPFVVYRRRRRHRLLVAPTTAGRTGRAGGRVHIVRASHGVKAAVRPRRLRHRVCPTRARSQQVAPPAAAAAASVGGGRARPRSCRPGLAVVVVCRADISDLFSAAEPLPPSRNILTLEFLFAPRSIEYILCYASWWKNNKIFMKKQ